MKTLWVIVCCLASAILGLFIGHKYGKNIAEKAHELKDKVHSKDDKK